MSVARGQVKRVLAVDPMSRGFGFVVLEGSYRLVDWGTREARIDKEKTCLNKIVALWERYEPDLLVLEDYTARKCRRSARMRRLISGIQEFAVRRKIRVRLVSRSSVRAAFAASGAKTKDETARMIAAEFPELAPHLPPPRKPWMTEDQRMGIFGAVALALAVLGKRTEQSRERPPVLNVQRRQGSVGTKIEDVI